MARTLCTYCNSKKIKLSINVNKEYSIYRCGNCGVLFTYPQPRIDWEDINNERYNSKKDKEAYLGIYDKIYKRARAYISLIKKYKEKGKYLDVGCSYGIYLKAAREAGYAVSGVEIAPHAAKYAKKELKLDVFNGTLDQAKFKKNTFDIVTLYDVLEHVPNIHKFLKEIYRVMKPGGILVIQSPNSQSFAFRILGTKWNWLLVPNHLWHFSYPVLNKILLANGFVSEYHTTWDDVYDFSTNLRTAFTDPFSKTKIIQKVLRRISYPILYASILLGTTIWSRYDKGGSLRVYAIKK